MRAIIIMDGEPAWYQDERLYHGLPTRGRVTVFPSRAKAHQAIVRDQVTRVEEWKTLTFAPREFPDCRVWSLPE